ncbi:DUF4118 domain-containing protein [Sphingomonas ginkgonis]|uniref:histidine kinase n=1 Tax=Sphingomonas ginkgonis TaxID=2315330 RepID=A0A3R9WRM7_9SPHN|nr:histidine kinase dimerization/phosphoacceptor domain -containing protein [Sphingomonas ginkgonis]RST31725.1 DUF4118 domain-containing protein [Sphingomonas ginkgonis]
MTGAEGPSLARADGRLPLRWPWPVKAALAVAGAIVALLLRFALDGVLPPGFPFLTFFPIVVGIAFLLGSRFGLLAALLGGLLSWYFFIQPVRTFSLSPGSLLALAFYVFSCGVPILFIDLLQQSNASLRAERETSARLAETRELLFRELQHRISNNLQMVAALLTIQRRQVADPGAKAALDEASQRLVTVGRISRQLYDPSGAGRELAPFLDEIIRDILGSSGRSGIEHRVSGGIDSPLSPDAAIPVALVVAESIANAVEHGFEGRDSGQLHIRIAPSARDRLSIEIEDDGNGLPDGFSLDGSNSLGLRIATMLAGQLGGRFSLGSATGSGGTIARLDLPMAA